jgi:hypothetical protein
VNSKGLTSIIAPDTVGQTTTDPNLAITPPEGVSDPDVPTITEEEYPELFALATEALKEYREGKGKRLP